MQPADAYVRAFTRDVNRSRVLRARTLMQPVANGSDVNAGWPRIAGDMRLEDILPVALATEGSMAVINDRQETVGILSKQQVIAALAA